MHERDFEAQARCLSRQRVESPSLSWRFLGELGDRLNTCVFRMACPARVRVIFVTLCPPIH